MCRRKVSDVVRWGRALRPLKAADSVAGHVPVLVEEARFLHANTRNSLKTSDAIDYERKT
jgi:hypothetical protein